MKKLLLMIMLPVSVICYAQGTNPNHSKIPNPKPNAAYVHHLYAKYPTTKSNLCSACRIWVNPFYTSIADTAKGYPVCEHAIVTAQDVADQEAANIPRTGIYAAWSAPVGSTKVDDVYSYANKQ